MQIAMPAGKQMDRVEVEIIWIAWETILRSRFRWTVRLLEKQILLKPDNLLGEEFMQNFCLKFGVEMTWLMDKYTKCGKGVIDVSFSG